MLIRRAVNHAHEALEARILLNKRFAVTHDDAKSAASRQTFATAFDPKNNAFGFLRLALAVLVIFSHCYPLGAFGVEPLKALTDGQHTIGLVAVAMFFVLSGFLICRSAAGSASTLRFLWHRALRILPGYWVCLIVCAFVFAPLFAWEEYGSIRGLFSPRPNSPQQYIIGNAALFHFNEFSLESVLNMSPRTIVGLLADNPHPYMINGSLWTLPIEVGCYLGVAALACLGILRRARGVMVAISVVLGSLHVFAYVSPAAFHEALPYPALRSVVMLALFFSAGCFCFLYRTSIPCSAPLFATSVVLLTASVPAGAFDLVAPITMPYSFLWLAFRLPFGKFERRGDFSYGTYIYAFPVQQGLALVGVHHEGLGVYLVTSLLLTGILAVASYYFVEAPCLRMKNYQPPAWRRFAQREIAGQSDPVGLAPVDPSAAVGCKAV